MEYIIHILILIGIYSILAVSLNLLVGYTGLLSLAHAGFYGIGAYTVAILLTKFSFSFWIALPLAMIMCGIVAFFIGQVLSRFRDDYYVLASLGFCIIVFNILLNWQSLTRGPLGIPGITRPELFGFQFSSNISFLILTTVIAVIVYGLCHLVVNSSFGRALMAIREDEPVLAVFGYKTHQYKLVIFVISAMLAAVAGGLFASYITFIDPSSFGIFESVFVLSIIILGGLASLRGSIIGVVVLVLLPEVLRFVGFPSDIAAQMRQVVYGLLLVFLMLYRPEGFDGKYKL